MILANSLLPVAPDDALCLETAAGIGDGSVSLAQTFAVVHEIHSIVFRYAEAAGRRHGVDVRAKEEEFPAFLLLNLDKLAHFIAGEAAAGVFQAIGHDDEERAGGYVFGAYVAMNIADMLHGVAHGIEQGRTAGNLIVLFCKLGDAGDIATIVDDRAFIVEKHRGDEHGRTALLLFFEHGVEAAYGIGFEPEHGAAAVEDEDEFCESVHNSSWGVRCRYVSFRKNERCQGRLSGDI